MKINLQADHLSDDKKGLILEFTEWCGNKLLGPRLCKNIELTLNISARCLDRDNVYALTDIHPDEDGIRPRVFVIRMTKKFKMLRSLIIIGHEMVHVKQYARKELTHCPRTGNHKWHGQPINEDEIDYWDLPWEIEAHGREKGLVFQWVDQTNRGSDPWIKAII